MHGVPQSLKADVWSHFRIKNYEDREELFPNLFKKTLEYAICKNVQTPLEKVFVIL